MVSINAMKTEVSVGVSSSHITGRNSPAFNLKPQHSSTMKTKNSVGVPLIRITLFAGAMLWLASSLNIQAQYNYTSFSVPGAADTYVAGISGNNIVGEYVSGNNDVSYFYDGSSFSTISVPSAFSFSTVAMGVSGNNVVGYYSDNSGNTYGFLYNGSTYNTIGVPGSIITYAYGVSGNNVVGDYYTGSSFQGYLYDGNSFTSIGVPGAVYTQPTSMDGSTIAGWYQNSDGTVLGFVATPVPEPGMASLLGIGLAGLYIYRRRQLMNFSRSK